VPSPVAIELERVANETMGISVMVPAGWTEAAPGVYARGQTASDLTRLIQQAAVGASVDDITAALLPQLGISELPEATDSLTNNNLTWTLYALEVEAPPVGAVMVDLALAETETATYLVLLQTLPDDYQELHETVFLPAVQGFESSLEEEGGGAVYEDPDGRFTVPIPTNWTVSEAEQYVTLLSPQESLRVHILVLEGEDPEVAVDEAWQVVDPSFAKAKTETLDIPPSAAKGVDEFILVNYEREQDDPIVQVEGRLYEGQVYVLMFMLDLEAYQQRAAQVQLIDTGFDITGLEEADLSGVEPVPLTDEIIAELEAYILAQMEELNVPGAAVAIVRDGEVVYANGFGVRDRESGEPVTAETLMMIGSTTKPLTTMLMAQLVDDGVFTWDTPVVDILPSFRVADDDLSQALTMRNLVCACTGVPRRDFEWIFNANEMGPADVIASVADFDFFTDFGEAFQYSNQMVATAGYVSALAAGGEEDELLEAYVALMQERVFDPLAMNDSTFSFAAIEANENHATPYGQTPLGETVPLPLSTEAVLVPMTPAGALWSNVLDMANFVITNLSEGVAPSGTPVVTAANLAVTWEPQVEISADASYGLGWIIEEYKGVPIISHGGNTFGFTSELAFLPGTDLGVTILSNQQNAILNQAVRVRLLELLYEQESEVEGLVGFSQEQVASAREELQESLVAEIDAEAVAPYLGDYHNDVLGAATLAWRDDALVLDVGEFQTELRASEDEEDVRYVSFTPPLAGISFEFTEDEGGNSTITFGAGVVEYTFDKIE
jgi:CubicO group peptidase (beta-lactamase class C family)